MDGLGSALRGGYRIFPGRGQNSIQAKNIQIFDEFAREAREKFTGPPEKSLWGPGEPHFFQKSTFKVILMYFIRVFRYFWQLYS